MNIVLVLFKEGEALDPESLLGHVAITDGFSTIKATYTYIDSWFYALISGLRAVAQEGSPCIIDLVDEPEPLVFDLLGKELCITYSGKTVNLGTVEDFATTLRSAGSLFVETMRDEACEGGKMLKYIQEFVSPE